MSSSSPIRARAAGARLPKDRADLSEVPLDPNGGCGGSSDDDHSHSRPESPSSLSADNSGSGSGGGASFASPMAAAHDASEQGKAAMLGPSNSASSSSSSSSSFGGSAGPSRRAKAVGWCDGQRLMLSVVLVAGVTVALALVAMWVLAVAGHTGRSGASFAAPAQLKGRAGSQESPAAVSSTSPEEQSPYYSQPYAGPATRAEADTDTDATVLLLVPGAIDPHVHSAAVHAQILATETQRQRIEAHEAAVAAGRLVSRPKPRHEHGSGRVTHQTQHLFLRSAPRARAVHQAPTAEELDGRVAIAVTGSAREINFGVRTDADANTTAAAAAAAAQSHPAAPFLVHVKPPCTHSSLSQLRTAVAGLGAVGTGAALNSPAVGGWHVDKYVHVNNYLVVPNDSAARESDLLAELDRIRPLVVSWSKYEEQDKIEPYLCTYERVNAETAGDGGCDSRSRAESSSSCF